MTTYAADNCPDTTEITGGGLRTVMRRGSKSLPAARAGDAAAKRRMTGKKRKRAHLTFSAHWASAAPQAVIHLLTAHEIKAAAKRRRTLAAKAAEGEALAAAIRSTASKRVRPVGQPTAAERMRARVANKAAC